MDVNEPVAVLTDQRGAPIAFTWRGTRYVTVSEPEMWFAKATWWRAASATHQVERRMWRVGALPCSGPRSLHTAQPDEGIYDLCPDHAQGWLLVAAYSDELNERLFA